MSPDSPSSPGQRARVSVRPRIALDGEVIPPTMRVRDPEGERTAPMAPAPAPARVRLSTALLAGALAAALSGVVALEGYRWHLHATRVAGGPSATATALGRLGKDVSDLKTAVASATQDQTIDALRKNVKQLESEITAMRGASTAAVTQLTAKLDAKASAQSGSAISDVVARLDKLDHDPRLADIASRLDRIEHQVSSPAPTGSVALPGRAPSGQSTVTQVSAAAAARLVKPAILDSWIVRDVYSGIALVEGRTGSVREVVPGETPPGAGEVRSIERRGRGWIVVTSRGIIDTATW